MTETVLDSFPVSQLQDRYKIVRSGVYSRLDALKIKPEKQGNKAFINADQLALLDQLHQHIEIGGSAASFINKLSGGQLDVSTGQTGQSKDIVVSGGQLDVSTGQTGQNFVTLLEILASKLQGTNKPLANLEALEEAFEKGWLLSSSQLAPLLGLKSLGKPDGFERFGFKFFKSGKNGTQTAWRVEKAVREI
jgi:hypothetical protein